MSRESKQSEAYQKRETQIIEDVSLTPKQRSKALLEAEEEIYGDPQEEAREAAERDNYGQYLP